MQKLNNKGEKRQMNGISGISKEYYKQMYNLAILDYLTAHNEDERWSARKQMANFEGRAFEDYGAEFVEELAAMKFEKIKIN